MRAVQNVIKVELTTILHERKKNQESEEAEQTASQSESTEQLEHPQPKCTKLERLFYGAFRKCKCYRSCYNRITKV